MESGDRAAASGAGRRRLLWFCAYYGLSLAIFAAGVYGLRALLAK